MVSSLMVHDFLLAAMVVCLELSIRVEGAASGITTLRNAEFERLFDALKMSHMIWTIRQQESKEARYAAQALHLMINTVGQDNDDSPSSSSIMSLHKDAMLFEQLCLPYTEPMADMISGTEDLNWVGLRLNTFNWPKKTHFITNFLSIRRYLITIYKSTTDCQILLHHLRATRKSLLLIYPSIRTGYR